MPQDQPDDPSDSLFEAAVQWHARLRDAGPAAEPDAAFLLWVEQPQHRAAFEEVQRLWAATATPAMTIATDRPAAIPASRPRRRSIPFRGALAAGLLLALAAGVWLLQGGYDDLRSDHVTATGERQRIALADGSSIMLNTDTAIAIDLQPQERRVRLFRGEAFFSVSPDPARPFVVQTGSGEVRVIGTSFNVRLSERGTLVSVVSGQVETAGPSGSGTRMKAGQQIILGPAGAGQVEAFDLSRVSAWRRGQIAFYRTPLSEVVSELNRYHTGKILVWDERLRDRRVSGVFGTHDPAAAVDLIAQTLPARVTRLAGNVTLLR